jgi:beta-glucosidase/6-phospho-beta-glucosidase/beta-galactosidase
VGDYADLSVSSAFDHPEFVDGFEYYARTVLAHYADRVGTWYTFNEPTIEASLTRQWSYSRNVLMAHAKVVRWYRDTIKGSAKWSMKLDLTNTGFALPLDPSNGTDVQAAIRRNDFSFGYFANPLYKVVQVPQTMIEALGERVPQYTPEELDFINGTADFFAFDIYTATYHSEPAGGYKRCIENITQSEWPACTTRFSRRETWESNFHANVDRAAVRFVLLRSVFSLTSLPLLPKFRHQAMYRSKH